MSWRMDGSAGAAIWDSAELTGQELLGRDEELRWLIGQVRTNGNWSTVVSLTRAIR